MDSSPVPRTSSATVLLRSAAALILVLTGLLAAAPAAWAAEVRGDENVVVAEGDTVADDLYATGGDVVVDGAVGGDLVVAARRVVVSGTVEGDLIAAAQTVVIEGTVGDDARLAGQVLVLDEEARVAGDLVTAGYSLRVEPGAVVGGDVLLAGYQALLAGTVDGDVDAVAAALALAGRTGGDVQADVGAAGDAGPVWMPFTDVPVPPVDAGLVLTGTARLDGDLSYRSGVEAAIAPEAEVAGAITYERIVADPEPADPAGPAAPLLDGLRLFLTLLLVGLLALWLLPRTTARAASALRTRPFLSLGWGALTVAGVVAAVPVVLFVSILLAIALGGLSLGGLAAAVLGTAVVADVVLALVVVLAVVLLAPVVAGLTGGGLLVRRPAPDRLGQRLTALVAGLLIYVLLRAVPYLGPLVAFLVVLLGTGALVLGAWDARARRRSRSTGGEITGPGRPTAPVAAPQQAPPPWAAGGPGREPHPDTRL